MTHPRLSDAERDALQDEYSVMPAAISDEGIAMRDMRAQRDEMLEALREIVRCVRGGDKTAGVSMDDALDRADSLISEITPAANMESK